MPKVEPKVEVKVQPNPADVSFDDILNEVDDLMAGIEAELKM